VAGILFTSANWGNFGLNIGEADPAVLDRRSELAKSLSIDSLVFMSQSHSNIVNIVNIVNVVTGSQPVIEADAVVTCEKGVGLAVLVGDCVPILIRSTTCVAAIHAGRIGMTNGIVVKAIDAMKKLNGEKFEAIMGPSICSDCYEVSAEMYKDIAKSFPHAATTPSEHKLDLQSELAYQLTSAGVEALNLGICTFESSEYFSHRRSQQSGKPEGRQVGVIWL